MRESIAANVMVVAKGDKIPPGATVQKNGVNFSLFSEHATSVWLLLFDPPDSPEPSDWIELDPSIHKTDDYWHVFVPELKAGAHYAYRVDGPPGLGTGYRFDKQKVLIDPYGRGNAKTLWDRGKACSPGDNVATSMRSVVIDTSGYDWEGDKPLRHRLEDTIIYEMHVRGFTKNRNSGVQHRGTFQGVIEKIPYLKELGVTAVELMPVFDFDKSDVLGQDEHGKPLVNYWGYSPIGFFAPQCWYCVSAEESDTHLNEFRDMVKALHKAGIEVILDVVFNHTGEGDHRGPIFSYKGIDNRTYYLLKSDPPWEYENFSGCGNTLRCNHKLVVKMIVNSLKYWVKEGHVDGFRFDEASILTRDEHGVLVPFPPVITAISTDPDLSQTKLIAEPWEIGKLMIGSFPGEYWSEWNACYRDHIGRFVRGEPGIVGLVAKRLAGSADLYEKRGGQPVNSINYVASHDGPTLNDLVSSWDCNGDESLRNRQIRNFATLLLLSQGVPMFLAGDEVRRTQSGNNNAYDQDNPISWFDWDLVNKNSALFRFWKLMIEFRMKHKALRRDKFFTGERNKRDLLDVAWHGKNLKDPGWLDPYPRALAMTLAGFNREQDIYVAMNMWVQPLHFEVPIVRDWSWYGAVDTSKESPEDIIENPFSQPPVPGTEYEVQPWSVVVLVNKPSNA